MVTHQLIDKNVFQHMINELPQVEFNEQTLIPLKRINQILSFLPVEVRGRTTMQKNSYNTIRCTYCGEFLPNSELEVAHFKYCPYCGLDIEELKFDNY